MNRWLWLALIGLLAAATWGSTSPTNPEKPQLKLSLPAYNALTTVIACKGGERTCAIAATITNAPVLLALYVYDEHGNCVGRDEFDDRGLSAEKRRPAADDVAVEWWPPVDGSYTVELCNLSSTAGVVQMAIR
jgi:hypothetical protein